jgi:hypothetical protein
MLNNWLNLSTTMPDATVRRQRLLRRCPAASDQVANQYEHDHWHDTFEHEFQDVGLLCLIMRCYLPIRLRFRVCHFANAIMKAKRAMKMASLNGLSLLTGFFVKISARIHTTPTQRPIKNHKPLIRNSFMAMLFCTFA